MCMWGRTGVWKDRRHRRRRLRPRRVLEFASGSGRVTIPLARQAAAVGYEIVGIEIADPMLAAYCASKAALNAFSEALMQEVRHDGVRVAYVLPGSVDTEFGGRGGGSRASSRLQ